MAKVKADTTQKITPNLWFDDQAEEAVNFYTSVFNNSTIEKTSHYGEAGTEIHGQKAGTVMTVEFQIEGYSFTALNGGPHFKFTPAISFFVNCETEEEVDELWEKLSDGGTPLMPLDSYPFSEKYGWIQDKYGLSWQLILSDTEGDRRPKIIPSLLFVGEQAGRAEEAISFYKSLFNNSEIGMIARYGADQEPDEEGTIMFADFKLEDQWFAAMDSAHDHEFGFNEAISLIVNCQTQEEVDYFWEELSAVPEAEQCGWLKDKYGVSWQIIPEVLPQLLNGDDPEKSKKAMQAMLQMKKIDIEKLEQAYEQE